MKTELRKVTYFVDVPTGGLYVDMEGVPMTWATPRQHNPPGPGMTRYAFTVELPVQVWEYAKASEAVPISTAEQKTEGR